MRSLLAALELDALVGTEAMARIFTLYDNKNLGADEMARALAALAPAKAAELTAFWSHWVTGSGDHAADTAAVRGTLADADFDGLYLFEERRLGTSDAGANDYLTP